MCIVGRLLFPWLLGLMIIISFSTPIKSNAVDDITMQPQKIWGSDTIRILWIVSAYKLSSNAAWGDEEARKLLFKPLDITATTITFDGKKCSNVIFTKEIVRTNEYLGDFFHITSRMLDIADETVEVIKTNCNLPGFAEYLRLRDRRLVVHINGVFFYFEPAVNY